MLTDAALVKSTLAGDRASYAELVRRYERSVQSAAWVVVRDVHLAQDVAQDAFLMAYRGLGSLANPDAFGPWVLTIARRRAAAMWRVKVVPAKVGEMPEVAVEGTEVEEASALLAAVARLPEHE